ncbi:MAG: class I SAM-dependent methyltransferase [Candidatus Microthrix parvicella]|nr:MULTISPECIES: class I SAM-dependent methyltransferase [Microthrix]NLH68205.1 class I SAM-dependent methyltransferase [Candidatus Microthrix parvicella]MBK6503987.1 class I SAM-dependent methyltransferase [Candidatus Microthrix sp.]MBK7019305.1 class I SAM-dependent methyltransferase [Candidatus Microthrix sp.]MBK7320937.1 class I SAM-dependent methyltransferase [Candidatus Microthrix sp.]MBL0204275.1 class I SAM-dependent methyltransferase [Candidatus Microthrix sp.]
MHGSAMGQQASSRWATTDGPRGAAYDERFARLAASGEDVHGEATFVAGFQPRSVLDAGCGTGRVAMELRRRGIESVGVDADRGMLAAAVARDPDGEWLIGDISTLVIADDTAEARRFDVVVAAGNVMIFLAPGTETATVANLAAHLVPGGALICGFQLQAGRYPLDCFDADCEAAGLVPVERWSTWDRQVFDPDGGYVVAVHRRPRHTP